MSVFGNAIAKAGGPRERQVLAGLASALSSKRGRECEAENDSNEPSLTNAAPRMNDRFQVASQAHARLISQSLAAVIDSLDV